MRDVASFFAFSLMEGISSGMLLPNIPFCFNELGSFSWRGSSTRYSWAGWSLAEEPEWGTKRAENS